MKNTEVLRQLNRAQTAKYIELTVRTAYLDLEQRKCREKLVCLDTAALETLLSRTDTVTPTETVEALREDLKERDWTALEGKYILGYSDEELSAIFGVSADSVRTLLSRARKRARKILREKDLEGDA